MKTILLFLSLVISANIFAQNVNVPDANFKERLVLNSLINTNGDTEIQVSEATAFAGSIFCNWCEISNLTGIEAFTSVTDLQFRGNQLTNLDISSNTALTYFDCRENLLTSLDVSANTALTSLTCSDNLLTILDVSANTALSMLECKSNQLTSLDVSGANALTYLNCSFNDLTSLDVSQFENLSNLDCFNNQITYLDVSQNEGLLFLSCTNNELDTLIMPEASQNFRELDASNNNLTHLEMTNYALVAWIGVENNQLNSVDLSGSTVEFLVSFNNNLITEINLDGSDLTYLLLENNQLSFLDLSDQSNLGGFSATSNPDLECIKISENQFNNNPFGPNSWTVDATTSYALECGTTNLNETTSTTYGLFPNPCNDILNISGIEVGKNFTIYDHSGKIIFHDILKKEAQINISDLESGIYLLTIESFGTKVFRKK